jgi:WD40 repeat protein
MHPFVNGRSSSSSSRSAWRGGHFPLATALGSVLALGCSAWAGTGSDAPAPAVDAACVRACDATPDAVLRDTPVVLPDVPPADAGPTAPFRSCGYLGGRIAERVVYSPDGSLLAVVGRGALELVRASDGTLARALEDSEVPAYATVAVFSADGTTLVSGNADGRLRVWRVGDGALLRTIAAHETTVSSVALSSAGGGIVASVALASPIRLWRLADGSHVRDLSGSPSGRPLVSALAFAPDGSTLAAGGAALQLWRVADGSVVWTGELPRAAALAVAFSPDGRTVASGSMEQGGLRLWNAADGALLGEPTVMVGDVPAVAFSPDGSTVANSQAGAIQLWRVADRTLLRGIPTPGATATSVAFAPAGDVVASSDDNGPIRLWRAADATLVRELAAEPSSAGSVTFSSDPSVRPSVVFSPDGAVVATSAGEGRWNDARSIRLWRASDRAHLRDLPGGLAPIAFLPDGVLAGIGSPDLAVLRFWRVSDGSVVRDLPVGTLSPDGRVLASVWRGSVTLRRVSDGSVLGDLTPGGGVASLAFSPDSGTLAVGMLRDGSTTRVSLWRVADRTLLREVAYDGGYAYSVAFSHDGSVLATGMSADSATRLWRVSDGAPLRRAEVGREALVFSPDDAVLAGGNFVADVVGAGTVQLWRAADGASIGGLPGHGSVVAAIGFSPDGAIVAAGGSGRVRMWCRR